MANKTLTGQVRIIGGMWRGRKLNFPAIAGLRPTPDRIKETVFNWLAPYIVDARCLDLFAGSGALGFEALSRGAKSLVMNDQSPVISHYLREQVTILNAKEIEIFNLAFPQGFKNLNLSIFDIIFLDPPFHQNLLSASYSWLHENHLLAKQALIYMEAEAELNITDFILPTDEILCTKKAGNVGYHLLRVGDN